MGAARASFTPCAAHIYPVAYGSFEGIIPQGQYGGGTVLLWDRGTWTPLEDPRGRIPSGEAEVPASRGEARGRLVPGEASWRKGQEQRQGGWAELAPDQGEGRRGAAVVALRRDRGAA